MRLTLLLFVFLSSCAFQNLFVSQLDTFIEYRLNSQLDLYYQQKKDFSKDIDHWLNQQKKYIPQARELLDKIDPTSPKQFGPLLEEISLLVKEPTHAFNQLLVSYLKKLDQKQIEIFFKKQQKSNTELEVEITGMKLDKLKDRAEFFIGSLQASQLTLFENYLPRWQERAKSRLLRRRKLHEELKSILHSSNDTIESALNDVFRNYVEQSFIFENQEMQLLINLAGTLNAEQKNHLSVKIQKARELLETYQAQSF